MITFGTCSGFPEKLAQIAEPGLALSMSREIYRRDVRESAGCDLFVHYEAMMRVARQEKAEALVLMHDDLEWKDPKLAQKIRTLLEDPSIAIVGLIGSRGARTLAWWEGERKGRVTDDLVGLHQYGFDGLKNGPLLYADVDKIDGMVIILSPWALESLSLVDTGYVGFHGYADELCSQALAKGKRVVVANIEAHHHSKGGVVGEQKDWIASNERWRQRWLRGPLIERIRAAGTDSIEHFGNGYTFEGGLSLQQNPEELADLILLLREHPHETYLEIGSGSGGTAKLLAEEIGIRAVSSIDDGTHHRHGEHPIEHQLIEDSHSAVAKAWVKGSKFDIVLVDGDHSFGGVQQDFELVLPVARIIVAHDVVAIEGGARHAWDELIKSGRVRQIALFIGKEKPLGIAVGEVVQDPWKREEVGSWDIEANYASMRGGPVSAQPSVMLATPAYNPPHLEFLHMREMVSRDLAANAVGCTTLITPGDSLVMRGRHAILSEFLKSDCTHLVFWDVDIEPKDPTIIRQMLATGHDIVGGACPFRGEEGKVVCNIRQEDKIRRLLDIDMVECAEVAEVGTGFLLMSRKAIVRLCEAHPELLYFSDLPNGYGEPMWALFDTFIANRRFLSEDYFFCKLWRDLGEKVYVYTPFEARHWGRKGFEATFRGAHGGVRLP